MLYTDIVLGQGRHLSNLASIVAVVADLSRPEWGWRSTMNRPTNSVFHLCLLLGLAAAWVSPNRVYAQAIEPRSAAQTKISRFLDAELAATSGPVDFLVILQDQPDPAVVAADAAAALDTAADPEARRVAKLAQVYASLTQQAQSSQAALRAWLDAQGIAYRPFYLVNMIWVQGDRTLAESLAARPEVARLAANPRVAQPPLPESPVDIAQDGAQLLPASVAPDAPLVPYGLVFTHAPQVWAQGHRGEGIVVAGQDTGVQWDHPALKQRYRGWNNGNVVHTYSWFDAWAGDGAGMCDPTGAPCDDQGHGTHTVGTMLGQDNNIIYGMAPQATWIACRNMFYGFGTPVSYTTCFEFFLAPYPQGGDPFTDGRPDLAPHIINNSWGCPSYEGCDADSLRQVVETVRAAGQLVVSSAGNSGREGCGSVADPIAIYDAAFTVGAHDHSGTLAAFSSTGPVAADDSGRLKPDLTAPGVGVLSTTPYSATETMSGTSMASPHVAGAAALLWSAVPTLIGNPDLIEQLLIKSAAPVLSSRCTDALQPVWPNPLYGYGLLDVAAALEMAQQPWQVTVEVLDLEGNPPANATVVWEDVETGYRVAAQTSADGMAQFDLVWPGRYTLTVQFGRATLRAPEFELAADTPSEERRLHYRAQLTERFYYIPWLIITR